MIPYVRELSFDYAKPEKVSPLIRRIIARNPGPFTYTGTGTYIIGPDEKDAEVFVIDPGPDMMEHLEAILGAVAHQRLTRIFITHAHMDHSPLARALADETGAIIYAGPEPCIPSEGDVRLEAGDDLKFRPDEHLNDGMVFKGSGFSLEAMATPGHTANHYAYVLQEENALFPGDCIMGWSTTVISPPDGCMSAYMSSLNRIRARGFKTYWPTHGPPVTQTAPFIEGYIAHRKNREKLILNALSDGHTLIKDMVATVYQEIDKKLYPAAAHSMLAHLIDLTKRGIVSCDGEPDIKSRYLINREAFATIVS